MSFSQQSVMTAVWVIITRLLAFSRFATLRGSSAFSCSLGYALGPLIGFYSSTAHVILAYGVHTLLSGYGHSLSILVCITHLPTLCGTLFLTLHSRLIKGALSALCIVLFLLHPVGYACSYYSIYWFPPLIIGLLSPRSPLLQAVGSTMTTHAVGSILWLYTHDTTPALWNTLFYRVWAERIVCVTVLLAGYYIVLMVKTMWPSLSKQRNTCPSG